MTALTSTVLNLLCWRVGDALGGMVIGAAEVAIGSVVGALLGGVTFACLKRFTARPKQLFNRVTIVVLVLYAFGPVSAMLASYREGAPLFNLATLLATEVMHLVNGALGVFFLGRTLQPAQQGARP